MRLSTYGLLLAAFTGLALGAPTDGSENELMKRGCVVSSTVLSQRANVAQPITAIVNAIVTMVKDQANLKPVRGKEG
ncbi:hypothetical protein FE257_008390 [Aspergillus nanangensis]|uniref:Uncharacterized protein n=1 Tax=Aspergillus nanangensis TaxID=2582783 RepID=A0AAD4CN56_ASPNN|nr:hypothetical protein FE257_008390 [Aspergillus nanangensis]